MASVLVYVERDGDVPGAASLRVLGAGRRIASRLGATVYSAAVVGRDDDTDRWITALSRGGSDKIALLRSSDATESVGSWSDLGESLAAICEHLRPNLILLSHGGDGRSLAPRLAARLEASFLAAATMQFADDGELLLERTANHGHAHRRIGCDVLPATVVATLSSAALMPASGDDDADVLFFDLANPRTTIEMLDAWASPGSALEQADVVVTAGAGVSSEQMANIEGLAKALSGEWAVTESAARRGLGPRSRSVGACGVRVAPRLYISVGASGSANHLAGIASDSHIVAVCDDAEAPIMRIANYTLLGRCEDQLPLLIKALTKQAAAS